MDQLFDRLEKLVKSWISLDDAEEKLGGLLGRSHGSSSRSSRSGDPDLDEAMRELDDYLDTSRSESEKRESAEKARAERESRDRARRSHSAGSGYSNGSPSSASNETRRALEGAYATLELPFGSPLTDVKSAYKKLMKKHHPDLNSSTPEALKRATAISSRINVAYQMIEAWEQSGRHTIL